MKIKKIFLYLLLLIGFLPAFGAVDKVGFQWFYLAVLNSSILLYSIITKEIFHISLNKSFLSLFVFFLISVFSLFSTLNIGESVIEIFRYSTLITTLLIFYNLSKSLEIDIFYFQKVITVILFLEVIYFYTLLWYDFNFNGIINIKGISSNINIQAFSLVLKMPFVLLPFFSSKFKSSYISLISIWLSISILFIISSRAAFLSLFLISVTLLFWKYKLFKNITSLLKLYLLPFLVSFFILNPLLSTDSKFSSLTFINESSLTRIQFYKEALSTLIANPILGVGTGNWKLFSIQAHKDYVNGYTIPYHAHNDFLQIGAEIGLFGMVSYLLFFLFLFFILKKLYSSRRIFTVTFFLTICVYLIDANLNFPISRPLIQVQFLFFIGFLYLLYDKELNIYKSLNFSFLLLILSLISIYPAYKVYDSFTKQQYLLSDFQTQNFDTPIDIIESIDDDFPNVGATALPIKAIKSNYYNDSKIIASLLDKASIDNPFIKYPQALKSIRFRAERSLDSSLFYAKDAFEGLPFNELHVINYFSILTELKDSITIDSVFKKVKRLESSNILNSYILANLSLDRSSPVLKEAISIAMTKYPDENRFKLYDLRVSKGDSLIKLANDLFKKAERSFINKNFILSANTYLEASKLLPEDPAYLENAAHSFYMANQNNKALKLFDSIINNYSSKTGKSEYLKGLMLIETQKKYTQACDLFAIANRKGNLDAAKAINLFCK